MFDLFDPIFPAGSSSELGPPAIGIGLARRNRIPRWLVEIRRLEKFYYLSDVPGKLVDVKWVWGIPPFGDGLDDLNAIMWDQGIADISVSDYEIDLDNMTIPLAAATVHLTPDMRRFFDPMPRIHRSLVRVSYYDGKYVRSVVRGLVDDTEIGFDGEMISFRVVEKWRTNPDFPPAIIEVGRVSAARMVEGSEDKAYPYAFGDAKAVPAVPIRSWGDGVEDRVRIMYLGTGLHPAAATDHDPCPYKRFPFDGYPDVGDLRAWSLKGLWYGRNPCIRDDFSGDLAGGWEVVEGSFTQATHLESTANDSTLLWTIWNYEDTLSVAVQAEPIDAGAIVCFYWSYLDADNHVRVEFPSGGTAVRLVVREAAVDTVDESRDIEDGIGSGAAVFQINVNDSGTLTAGVRNKGSGVEATEVDFGSVAPSVSGKFAIGSKAGKVRWKVLRQPSMGSAGATETDPNAGIKHFDDNLKHAYVGEGFKDELGQPLFTDYRRADGVLNAGNFVVQRLLRDYSGVEASFIDDISIERLRLDLRRFRVGGFFNEVEPIFDLINDRLCKQFMFVIMQEAGTVKGFQFDPTLLPERKLIYGVDLLELAEPVREYEKFTRFRVRYKFNAARERWNKKEKLVPDNFTYLKALESRVGRNPMPRIDLPDVVDDGTANHILLMNAIIFHAGQRVAYLQRATDGADIQLGEVVEIDDPVRGFDAKRAFFVGRKLLSPEFVVNVFRTIEFFEESGQSGASVGEAEEPPVEEVPPEQFPDGSCWSTSGDAEIIELVSYVDGDTVNGVTFEDSNDYIEIDCSCGADISGEKWIIGRIRFEFFTGSTAGSFGVQFEYSFYTLPDCSDPPRVVTKNTGTYSGQLNVTKYAVGRTDDVKAAAGEVKVRIRLRPTPGMWTAVGATMKIFDLETKVYTTDPNPVSNCIRENSNPNDPLLVTSCALP